MIVQYTFGKDDQEARKHWENGFTYYVGLQEVELMKKRIDDGGLSNEELIEAINTILVESRFYD